MRFASEPVLWRRVNALDRTDIALRWWPEIVVLGSLPILIAIAVPIQLYPPPGWIDPSLYLGYFLNFPLLLARFGADYHGMRLPWVLSGFVAHRLFSPTVAQLALALGFHLAAVLSLYLIVTPRHGRLAALISSLFLTLNPFWIAAVTRGYVDGPSVAFQLASVAAVAHLPRFRTRWLPGLLSGFFGSLAVHTHPVGGLFACVAVLACLAVQRVSWGQFLRLSAWAFAAFLLVTAALGLVSVRMGGPFLFTLVSLQPLRWMIDGWGLLYARPLGEWLRSAYVLFPALSLLACALFALAFRPRGDQGGVILTTGALLLGSSLMASLAWDVFAGGAALQSSFYMTFLISGQVLIFAGLIGMSVEESRHDRRLERGVMFGALFLAGILPLLTVSWLWSAERVLRDRYLLWVVLVLIASGSVILLHRRKTWATLLLLLFATSLAGVANADTRRIFQVDGNPSYRAFYRAAQRVNGFIRSNLDADRRLLLWFNRDDFTTGDAGTDEWLRYRMSYQGQPLVLTAYDSFASLWLWHRPAVSFTMPAVGAEELAILEVAVPASLAMFCPQVTRCEQALRELERHGFSAHPRAQTRIVEPTYIDLIVAVVDLERR